MDKKVIMTIMDFMRRVPLTGDESVAYCKCMAELEEELGSSGVSGNEGAE